MSKPFTTELDGTQDSIGTLYDMVRAGRIADTEQLHITRDEFVETIEALIAEKVRESWKQGYDAGWKARKETTSEQLPLSRKTEGETSDTSGGDTTC